MKKFLVGLVFLVGCTDEGSSYRTLQAHGFTDITFTGWSPFVCSKDDRFSTGFTARNSAGQQVSGTVCCGLLTKGCTVRF